MPEIVDALLTKMGLHHGVIAIEIDGEIQKISLWSFRSLVITL